jgi:hypothetical protein
VQQRLSQSNLATTTFADHQVLGNAKGVFATGLSIMVFGNPWTISSIGG